MQRKASGFLCKPEILSSWEELASRIDMTVEETRHEVRCILRDEFGIDVCGDARALVLYAAWTARVEARARVLGLAP